MSTVDLTALHSFIVRAKAATYAGDGQRLLPYRLGSHDLQFQDGPWAYHDSYVGESDFMGQELVYFETRVIWGMNYFGRIIQPGRITSAQAGQIIKKSLSQLYREGRFLGGYEYHRPPYIYIDTNQGDPSWFQGREYITLEGEPVYELVYHGGLIKH